MLLSAALVVASVSSITAMAASDTTSGTTYQQKSFTANKITHPENGLKAPDGIVDYIGNSTVTDEITGVGDRAQNYAWSAIGYGDWVYIGTCPNAMTQTLNFMGTVLGNKFDKEIMIATLNAMFNGAFFTAEEDGGDPKGILVKVNTKTGEVKLLMSKATTNTNVQFRNVVELNGKFYFCGSVNGLPTVYQVDPATDEYKKVYQSIDQADFYKAYQMGISVGIRGISTFENKLIISLVGLEGAYICESDNPEDPDSFKVIATMSDMFNYPAYRYQDSIYGGSIWDMAAYNGSLYVSICTGTPENKPDNNTMQSFALIKGDRDDNGKWTWTSVIGDKEKDNAKYTYGIDPESTRSGAANLCVYDGYLYIGEYNDEEIALERVLFDQSCDFMNSNLEQSVNLYRMDENEEIKLVVGDADEMFPDGGLTGLGSGFDRNENQYIWRMQVYNNKLYVGTFDTSSPLEPIGQLTNGDLLKMTDEEWQSQIEYIKVLAELILNKYKTPQLPVAAPATLSISRDDARNMAKSVNNAGKISRATAANAENVIELAQEIENTADEKASEEFIATYTELSKASKDMTISIGEIIDKIFTEENIAKMTSFVKCAAYMSTAERGFDIFTLDSNLNVKTVTTNGFGDPYNHGCRTFAVTDDNLIVGTANPFYGTQIWTLSDNKYDLNEDSKVDVQDVTFAQCVVAGTEEKPADFDERADYNKDGKVDINDITAYQIYLAENNN
ncbi:dockerin type I repeat-containing protein [uncultured Ruminococcus sp.]|uniref:dockerin type I repeat-containing protein n=1 Tax=uncultured Ruminococcus sp. TaxID=165186 RepID=UPI0025E7287F|nr:dockerin type I repeat-containing protein [uncultured Ruminococcus sp.]